MAYHIGTAVTTRENGTRHYVTAKPKTHASIPAVEAVVDSYIAPNGRTVLNIDQGYDYEGTGGNRYTGTKRVCLHGTPDELAALHAQIGAALGLTP